ncbi:MAG: polysaccharide deacetylase family protein [Eubacteriales bacterium]|nr:polysaccharide deacetylase family protein [Eubacteriales bacterium]
MSESLPHLASAFEDDKTDFILETLKKHDVKATFFLCGFWAEKYPDKVRAMVQDGHVVGNHSATHPHMASMSAAAIEKELAAFEKIAEPLIGARTTLFRAPYGEYNDTVILTARSLGYEVVQWDVDTVDWREERSAQDILDTVLPALKPGSIILCHNNGYKIKEYLPTLLETAQAEGYTFVTVDKLLLEGETIIDVNGMQKAA